MSDKIKKRKIILDLAVTLDGFIEGKNGEVDWCIMDPEIDFPNFLNQIDTILYGRKSYDLWGQYCPKENDSNIEKKIWGMVHAKEKYVFSKTQTKTDNHAIYINENILEEVNNLKSKHGKDIWLYGGASLITTFINFRLVDEFRLSIHPIILGEGKSLFMDIKQKLNLRIINTRTFSSGVVQLIYHLDDN
jgi:dihydrofolate reductase